MTLRDVVLQGDRTGSEAGPQSEGARARPLRLVRIPAWLVFPLLLVLATVVLGALELSGSSASFFSRPGDDGGLVAGRARNVRYDEWFLRTPLLARQEVLGLPDHDLIGVGEHDMAVGNDLPTRGWEVVARPHHLPYHVLGIERAFALEWWVLSLALPGIGLYVLALALRVRPLTAALIAMIVVLSPVVQWWTVPSTGGTIGYACLSAAALIAATRVRSSYSRIGLALVAGWLAACLAVMQYPPWVIPMALLAGAAAVAAVAASYPSPESRRTWWLRLLAIAGIAGGVGGALLLGFIVDHRDAFDAIANSVYPGQRRSTGGEGDFAVLLSAPFDLAESTRSSVEVFVNGLNQSEASAGLFTLFAVSAALVAGRTTRLRDTWRTKAPLLALLGIGAIFLLWYLVPVPAGVGRFLLLDRVRSDRLLLPLAVIGALALALVVDARRPPGRERQRLALFAGTAAFAIPTLWAGWTLEIDGRAAPRWQVLLLAAAATAGIGLALSGRRVGLWLLVALFAASAAAINPVQHGLGVVVDSPAAQFGRDLESRPDTGAVLNVFVGNWDLAVTGGLTASGVPLVSGVNNYPDAAAWRILDPDGSSRRAWDRYNSPIWRAGDAGTEPTFELHPPANMSVTVDPCDPRLARLGVRTIVSDQELSRPCLTEISRTEGAPALFAYQINRAAQSRSSRSSG